MRYIAEMKRKKINSKFKFIAMLGLFTITLGTNGAVFALPWTCVRGLESNALCMGKDSNEGAGGCGCCKSGGHHSGSVDTTHFCN